MSSKARLDPTLWQPKKEASHEGPAFGFFVGELRKSLISITLSAAAISLCVWKTSG
jgi:hypothetical protein